MSVPVQTGGGVRDSSLLAEGLSIMLCGTSVGLAGAFGLSRVLRSFLFGVTPHDPLVLVVTPFVLIAIALVAMWVPAHRATRLDPATTLRSE